MDQLDRIEAKLDALLAALADDEEQDEVQLDLEGNEIPAYEGGEAL